jgi:hypothetical protein
MRDPVWPTRVPARRKSLVSEALPATLAPPPAVN